MQNLDPTGEYTDDEVKAALSGATGSRDWSFRYARLDSNNNYIEDVDYIQSCTVENNFLADIKRTAKFSILDTGNINYLQDRIQPFARLNISESHESYSDYVSSLSPDQRFTMDGIHVIEPQYGVFSSTNYNSVTPFNTFSTAKNYNEVSASINTVLINMDGSDSTKNSAWFYYDCITSSPMEMYGSVMDSAFKTTYNDPRLGFDIYLQTGTDQSSLVLIASNAPFLEIVTPKVGRYYINIYTKDSTFSLTNIIKIYVNRYLPLIDSITGQQYVLKGGAEYVDGAILQDGGSAIGSVPGSYNNASISPDPAIGQTPIGPSFNGKLSASFWAKVPDDWGSWREWDTDGSPDSNTLSLFVSDIEVAFSIDIDETNPVNARVLFSSQLIGTIPMETLQGIHNFVFTVDTDTSSTVFTAQAFMDGRLVGTTQISDWADLTTYIQSGEQYTAPTFVSGTDWYIDDIAIFYNKVLPTTNIVSIYDLGINSKPVRRGYVEWPQGVFILSSPKRTMLEGNTIVREVDAYDQLLALSEDSFDSRYTIPAGANCVKEIMNITGKQTRKNLVLCPLSGAYNNSGSAWATTSGAGYTTSLSTTNVHGSAINSIALTSSGSVFPAYLGAGFTISTPDAVGNTITYSIWVKSATAISVYPITYMVDSTQHLYGISQASTSTTLVPNVWTKITYAGHIDNIPASSFGVGITGYFTASGQTLYLSDPIAEVGTTVGTEFSGSTSDSATTSYTWSGTVGDSVSLATSKLINIVSSSKTFAQAMEWEPGTTKLKVINDILSYINYESAWFDENGILIGRPYISPSDRGAEFTYATDSDSVITGDIDQTVDLFKIPNKWVLVVSNPESAPLIGSYTNDNPLSPTSTISRGRTIVDYRTEQNAADQVTLDAKAARLAFEASQVYEKVDFNTGIMPIHSNSDVYNLIIDGLVVDNKYSETSWSMDLDPGSAMKHSVRRITTL